MTIHGAVIPYLLSQELVSEIKLFTPLPVNSLFSFIGVEAKNTDISKINFNSPQYVYDYLDVYIYGKGWNVGGLENASGFVKLREYLTVLFKEMNSADLKYTSYEVYELPQIGEITVYDADNSIYVINIYINTTDYKAYIYTDLEDGVGYAWHTVGELFDF